MIGEVPPEEVGRFSSYVERFRQNWNVEHSDSVAFDHFASLLPEKSDPLRRAVLLEFVAIDLATRLQRGQSVTLETYLKCIDELGPLDRLPMSLLETEFHCLKRSNSRLSTTDFIARYPLRAEEITRAFKGTMVVRPHGAALEGLVVPPPGQEELDSHETIFVKAQDRPFRDVHRTPSTSSSSGSKTDQALPIVLENGYQLVRQIGQGNFGEVWLSEAPGGVEVALKLVRIPAGKRVKQMEMRSLELMRRVRHPFLLQLQAFWATESQITMAMELADQSLRERAAECGSPGIPLHELVKYMTEAAEGIDFLHREQVVHRDIKPENLLLLRGHIKVADFGLARFMDESGLSLAATQVAGSPMYMAPEVWKGLPVSASDQYSLAVTYVELRLGNPPFSATSMVALMNEHLHAPPPVGGLPEAEQKVLRVAMAKNPGNRFATCTEMVQKLIEATRPPPTEPTEKLPGKYPSRWPRRLALASTISLACLAVVGLTNPGLFREITSSTSGDVSVRQDVTVEYGEQVELDVVTMHASQVIQGVEAADLPDWLTLQFDGPNKLIVFNVDVNAPLGAARIELRIATSLGESTKLINLNVVESQRLKLPPDMQPPTQDAQRVMADLGIVYDVLERRLPDGQRLEFQLIPRQTYADPPTFYIMRTEVSNRAFAAFAASDADHVQSAAWRKGALAGPDYLGVEGQFADLPVVQVTASEANSFASWIGGLLPTVAQWDKAAGANELPRGEGPFRPGGKAICIDRFDTGPLPVGSSPDDVSVFGVLDLAGSVAELTRDLLGSALTVPLAERGGFDRVILRGRSYHDPVPWTFDEADDGLPDSLLYDDAKPDMGFRVVVELL